MQDSRGKYLIKNTVIFAIGNMASKLITFFLVPLYTNALSTAEYGTVDAINTICMVLAPVLIMNISESVMRFSLDKDAEYTKILSTGITFLVLEVFITLPVIPISSLFDSLRGYGFYIYFFTITSSASQLFLCYLRGKEKLVHYSIGNVIHTFSIAIFNILFLLVLKQGVIGYFTAYILAAVITMVYAIVSGGVLKDLKTFKFDSKLTRNMLKYSVVLIPNTFMWWIMNSSDRIMVISMVSVASNGIYAVSYKLPTLVSTTTTIFNQAWSYSAIREDGAKDEEEYNNSVLKKLTCIVMLIGLMILTFTKPFFKVYVAEAYYDAWRYVSFLTIGCVYLTLATFMATSYTVHKDGFGYLFSGMFGALLNILLNFILIPIIGVYGAAVATCFSYIAVLIFRYFHTRKYIHYDMLNKYFVLGSFLLIVDAGLMYIDSIFAQMIQILLVAITLVVYAPAWKPLLKKVFHKVFHHTK